MSTFKVSDAGKTWNRETRKKWWKPGEVMHYNGRVNGLRVWIERALQRDGEPLFRVAFGEQPKYPTRQMSGKEAVKALRDHGVIE